MVIHELELSPPLEQEGTRLVHAYGDALRAGTATKLEETALRSWVSKHAPVFERQLADGLHLLTEVDDIPPSITPVEYETALQRMSARLDTTIPATLAHAEERLGELVRRVEPDTKLDLRQVLLFSAEVRHCQAAMIDVLHAEMASLQAAAKAPVQP